MITRSLPLTALLLLVPVALLALFAVRSLSLENDALDIRRDRLSAHRAATAASLVMSRLEGVGTEVLAKASAAYAVGANQAISAIAKNQAVPYVAVFDKGHQAFSVSGLEHQYYYARVFQDKAKALAASVQGTGKPGLELIAVANGYALIRCVKGETFDEICVGAHSGHVMNELRSALAQAQKNVGLLHVGLIAPNGDEVLPEGETNTGPLMTLLSGPLTGWQLRGEEPNFSDAGAGRTLIFYVIAAGMITVWLAMSWLLYRSAAIKEQSAASRVQVVAQLAHELRTPLANLKLHADLVRRKSSDASSVLRYGTVLDQEIDRLTDLAENAVAVARGAIASPKNETAVPDECVRSILERLEPILEDAKCRISFEAGASEAVAFDRASWERILVNLVDNARKYAPASEIRVATRREGSTLRLDVHDSGPGIADADIDLIFKPLERGTVSHSQSGCGLGLTAVRALARQSGGDCWVERQGRSGAHFVATMRVSTAPASHQKPLT